MGATSKSTTSTAKTETTSESTEGTKLEDQGVDNGYLGAPEVVTEPKETIESSAIQGSGVQISSLNLSESNPLTFSDIQGRIDLLYSKELFQPNAFYPTSFMLEVPPSKGVSASSMQDGQIKKEAKARTRDDEKVTDSQSFLLYFVNSSGSLTGSKSSYLQEVSTKTLDDFVEMELSLKSSKEEGSTKFPNISLGKLLPYLLSVDGLNTPKLPFVKKNGRLTVEAFTGASTCTLKFLASKEGEVLQNLIAWQSHWATYDFEKRSVAAKFNREMAIEETIDKGVKTTTSSIKKESMTKSGEVYLGLDYLNISPNGTTSRVAHLFLFGLMPTQIKPSWSSYGPQANTSGLPTIEVSCIYSHAFLGMPILSAKKDTGPQVRFLVYE